MAKYTDCNSIIFISVFLVIAIILIGLVIPEMTNSRIERTTVDGTVSDINVDSSLLPYPFYNVIFEMSSISFYERKVWTFYVSTDAGKVYCQLTKTGMPVMIAGFVSYVHYEFPYADGNFVSLSGYYSGETFIITGM
jgi:hypothetical protein